MRALPPNVAKELLITGATLDVNRAYQLGFVNRVVEAGHALDAAIELAEEICLSSPVSVRETLGAIAAQQEDDDAAGWDATAAAIEVVLTSEDRTEGVSAFFERRQPQWKGR